MCKISCKSNFCDPSRSVRLQHRHCFIWYMYVMRANIVRSVGFLLPSKAGVTLCRDDERRRDQIGKGQRSLLSLFMLCFHSVSLEPDASSYWLSGIPDTREKWKAKGWRELGVMGLKNEPQSNAAVKYNSWYCLLFLGVGLADTNHVRVIMAWPNMK